MQIIITILIIAGLVMFFGPESCSDLGDKTAKSEASSEESGTYSRSSESGSDEEDPFSEIREFLPDVTGPTSESEIVKQAREIKSISYGNECPNPDPLSEVRQMERTWLQDAAKAGKNYIQPEFSEDKSIYFGSGAPSFLQLTTTSNPSRDAVIARDQLFAMAMLEAKAGIIQQMGATFSVDRYLRQPRTGMTNEQAIYEKGEDLRQRRKEIANEIESVNEELPF